MTQLKITDLPYGKEVEIVPGVHFTRRTTNVVTNRHDLKSYQQAIHDLSNEALMVEIQQLLNSYLHLLQSNEELFDFANQTQDAVEKQEFLTYIAENKECLNFMKLKLELGKKNLIARNLRMDELFQQMDSLFQNKSDQVMEKAGKELVNLSKDLMDVESEDGLYL